MPLAGVDKVTSGSFDYLGCGPYSDRVPYSDRARHKTPTRSPFLFEGAISSARHLRGTYLIRSAAKRRNGVSVSKFGAASQDLEEVYTDE